LEIRVTSFSDEGTNRKATKPLYYYALVTGQIDQHSIWQNPDLSSDVMVASTFLALYLPTRAVKERNFLII